MAIWCISLHAALSQRASIERSKARDVPAAARKPGQLSGGQRQGVAVGRAHGAPSGCFLMDEPLSNLDAKLRVQVCVSVSITLPPGVHLPTTSAQVQKT